MGCRCNERRQAIFKTITAVKEGDGQAVASQLQFVATSTVEDLSNSLRSRVAQARGMLQGRR